ncbi:MAG: tetratricopeptide repeat protein [Bdellovibrionales bacterium]|nr:tetratricopeptide repeat protein [Bdellovibrionales bacterium]
MSRLESDNFFSSPQPFSNLEAEVRPKKSLQASSGGFDASQIQIAEAAFFSDENSIPDYLSNAKVLFSNREYRLASHLLMAALRVDSYHQEATELLGDCFYHLENWSHAERIYEIAYEAWSHVQTGSRLAECYSRNQKIDKALELYQSLIPQLDDSPDLFEIYKNLGNIFLKMGDVDAAEENYNKAFSIDPLSDVLLVNYGTLEIQKGLMDSALQRYRDAVKINNNNAKAWVGLALIHRHLADFELAWANLFQALDLESSNQVALQLCAEWGVKEGRVAEAIGRLKKHLEFDDQDAEISLVLAKLLYISGEVHASEIEATRALSLNPKLEGAPEFLKMLQGPVDHA